MKNYLTEKDPTLSQTRWAILLMWMIAIWLIVAIFSKPILNQPISPYDLNGYMQNGNYVWGQIR